MAEADSGSKFVSLSTVEPSPDLAQAMRSMGRAFETIAGLMQAQASRERVVEARVIITSKEHWPTLAGRQR